MSIKAKILKALLVFIGAISPGLFIYILSFFTTENAVVGSGENFADSVFSMLAILSYTGPFALFFAVVLIIICAQTSGKIFDFAYIKYFSKE